MTLKISYVKYIRENIRHRAWLAALAGILFFLLMPIYTLIYLDSFAYTAAELKDTVYDTFASRIFGDSSAFVVGLIVALAIAIAMTGFQHLHSKEKLDFFHSLPVKREQWFSISYISGLLIFVVPYILSTLLTIGIGAIKGIMDLHLAVQCFLAMGTGILAFLLIYHACILAGVLTGKNVTMFLGTLVISVYPSLVFLLIPALKDFFFSTTYVVYDSDIIRKLADLCSPAALYYKLIFSVRGDASVGIFIAAAVMIILLIVLSVYLHHLYPSEVAGNALAFKVTAPIFKVMICIPASLVTGVFVQSFIGIRGTKWVFTLSILAVIILNLLIEFIYHQDLTQLFKGWKSSLVSLSCVAILLVIFQFDLVGYDTYIPKKENIAKIAIRPDSFNGYFWYNIYQNNYEDTSSYEFVFSKETDMLYAFAQDGVSNVKDGLDMTTLYSEKSPVSDPENYMTTAVCYELNSGRKIYRQYVLSTEQVYQALEQLLKDESYKQDLFPIFHINEDDIVTISTEDLQFNYTTLNLTKEQRSELLHAYKQDLLRVDLDTLANKAPVGELSLSILDRTRTTPSTVDWGTAADTLYRQTNTALQEEYPTFQVGDVYIYDNYTETLECLEKLGYPLIQAIDPATIISAKLHISKESIAAGIFDDFLPLIADNEITEDEYGPIDKNADLDDMPRVFLVKDKEMLAKITTHFYSIDSGILGGAKATNDFAEVTFDNENASAYYSYKLL